jgi:hypothetical protein
MLTDFFKKKTITIDAELGFRSIIHLVNRHNLPLDKNDLFSLGNEEGLPIEYIEKVLEESIVCNPELENENFRKWCLEKIVSTLLNKVGRIDEDLYKVLVNLVNGLYLKFSFLDGTIRKVKSARLKVA